MLAIAGCTDPGEPFWIRLALSAEGGTDLPQTARSGLVLPIGGRGVFGVEHCRYSVGGQPPDHLLLPDPVTGNPVPTSKHPRSDTRLICTGPVTPEKGLTWEDCATSDLSEL